MKTVTKIADLPHGARIGFVPTMGAFHEGHLSLMRKAKAENDLCVVSLFVNPTQFGKNEDFGKYPRDLDRDEKLARSAGVDVLFAPSVSEVYPRSSTTIHVPEITELWEGAHRPGHFDGVATVVAKLINMVRPRVAYFGLKDLQQCMVIRRMAEDLLLPAELSFEPTVREADGLAMSSRNVYLSANERANAPQIYAELARAKQEIASGSPAKRELSLSKEALGKLGFLVDYFELVELPSMKKIEVPATESAIIFAGKLGTTRLIDNILL